MKTLASIVTTIVFCTIIHSTRAQHGIQFMASDTSWADSEYVGHAFMIISTRVGNGSKEDSYGFYPRSSKAFIYGPGIVSSEFTKNPSRFSRVTVSMQRPISDGQRRTVMTMIDDWNNRNYDLTSNNYIDFVNSVAGTLGWITPPRNSTDLPVTFLRKLKAANESIVGTWTWLPRDQIVTIRSDGTCSSTYNVRGTWRVVNASRKIFEIRWSNGFVDNLTLSADGSKLTGSNQHGPHPEPFIRRN